MSNLEDLRAERRRINEAINVLENAERERENQHLVGKCFRYKNSYSCPQGADDYWPLYQRIERAEDGGLVVFRFETDRDGKIEIERTIRYSHSTFGEEIPSEEFDRAWRMTVDHVADFAT